MCDQSIVCRCSDITIEEIRREINKGYHTFEELKRVLRTGMGPCQGRNCTTIILRELSIMTGVPMEALKPGTNRPPVKPISLGAIARQKEGNCHD